MATAHRNRQPVAVGDRFGRLAVTADVGVVGKYRRVVVLCDCGTTKEIAVFTLTSGGTMSCGCLRAESGRATGIANRTHGGSATPEFAVHRSMIARCERPTVECYSRYGGKGVKVCARWHAFAEFIADMGPRPTPKHSIDRIESTGNYSCGKCDECTANHWSANCRWATSSEQALNKSNNRRIDFRGERRTLSEWAAAFGIRTQKLWTRLKDGWSMERNAEDARARGVVLEGL